MMPDREKAIVPREKITEYLLSTTHPVGRHKSIFFRNHGFDSESWETLANALVGHAMTHEVQATEVFEFGIKYKIDGAMPTPDGRSPVIRSVWFVASFGEPPRLVTAFPGPTK